MALEELAENNDPAVLVALALTEQPTTTPARKRRVSDPLTGIWRAGANNPGGGDSLPGMGTVPGFGTPIGCHEQQR